MTLPAFSFIRRSTVLAGWGCYVERGDGYHVDSRLVFDSQLTCPRHGLATPCDRDPGHPEGPRSCDPSIPHCPRSNCGKPLVSR